MGISSALGSSALLPAGLGFRNLLINGDFRINQRGFTSETTNNRYGFDRWKQENSGGTVTYSAQTFTIGNPIAGAEPANFARIVTTGQSAASHFGMLVQRVESVRSCAGQQVTLSFWAKANSGTPKVAIEFQQNFGEGGSPSTTVGNYAGQVTLSTSWSRYSLTYVVPSISGKTLGTTNDGFLGLNIWVSAGSDYNSRTGSLGIQSNTFDFWGVQLEQNYQPTPFEQRPIGVELQLCQRYYCKIGNTSNAIIASGLAYSTTQGYLMVNFPVTMRAAPTALGQTGTATDYALVRSSTATTNLSSVPAFSSAHPNGAMITAQIGAADLVQGNITLLFSNNALAHLAFSTEL